MNRCVFVAMPHNSGSRFIWRALSTCRACASLPREGHRYFSKENNDYSEELGPDVVSFGVGRTFTEIVDTLRDESRYDWGKIKETWRTVSKYEEGSACIFVDKTPANIVIADILEKEFADPVFILSIRDPYAFVEGVRRKVRLRSGDTVDVKRVAKHWINIAKYQVRNLRELKNHTFFTYEEMCSVPHIVEKRIKALIPELSDFSLNLDLSNRNIQQVQKLSVEDLRLINEVLETETSLLERFGYKVISSNHEGDVCWKSYKRAQSRSILFLLREYWARILQRMKSLSSDAGIDTD